MIEYEVKSNIKKTMGNGTFEEMLKENLPHLKQHITLLLLQIIKVFTNLIIGMHGSKLPEWLRKSDEENVWYFDHNTGKLNMQKNVWGSNFNVEDSIPASAMEVNTE